MATFQLYWWWKTSGALLCIISVIILYNARFWKAKKVLICQQKRFNSSFDDFCGKIQLSVSLLLKGNDV
jgi:hypothetical protein